MQDIQPQSRYEYQASFGQPPKRKLSWKFFFYLGLALLIIVLFVNDLVFRFTANKGLLIAAFVVGTVAVTLDDRWAQWRKRQRMERQEGTSKPGYGRFLVWGWYCLFLGLILTEAVVLLTRPPSSTAYQLMWSFAFGAIMATGLRNAIRAWNLR